MKEQIIKEINYHTKELEKRFDKNWRERGMYFDHPSNASELYSMILYYKNITDIRQSGLDAISEYEKGQSQLERYIYKLEQERYEKFHGKENSNACNLPTL